jgi:hypothetical protein
MVYVANPAFIIEKKGVFAAMRRSRELTAGNRGRVFAVMLGVLLMGYVVAIILGAGLAFLTIGASSEHRTSMRSTTTVTVISSIWATFLVAWTATAAAVTYCHLRNLKDPEVEDLAEVFD